MTHINVKMPPLSTLTGLSYSPEAHRAKYLQNADLIKQKYQYEKFIGKRGHDGMRKLSVLKPAHKQYITAFLNGMKIVEIANYFNVCFLTVYRVLKDPLARALIEEFDEGFKEEFRRLFPLVTDSIRDGLNDENIGLRLKAADRFVKLSRLVDGEVEAGTDDKVKAVFAARTKFVQMVKSSTGAETLEVTETEVKVTA